MINRHVVITAGLDGDEYAGIQAASELKEEISFALSESAWVTRALRRFAPQGKRACPERQRRERQDPQKIISLMEVTVIPVVNTPGFAAGKSFNPLDGKYLKHIFPGKSNGSSSEQLMFKLYEQSLKGARLWIDLHGGSLTEELTPFVYSSETGNRSVNQLTAALLNSLADTVIIYTKRKTNYFIESVAQKGIAYLRLEAGQKGEKDGKWVNLHKNWVGRILTAHSLCHVGQCHSGLDPQSHGILKQDGYRTVTRQVQDDSLTADSSLFYRKTREYKVSKDSLWYPFLRAGDKVKKGQVLGKIYSLERKLKEVLKAREEGLLLWQKVCCFCRSGESLLEIAMKPTYSD